MSQHRLLSPNENMSNNDGQINDKNWRRKKNNYCQNLFMIEQKEANENMSKENKSVKQRKEKEFSEDKICPDAKPATHISPQAAHNIVSHCHTDKKMMTTLGQSIKFARWLSDLRLLGLLTGACSSPRTCPKMLKLGMT